MSTAAQKSLDLVTPPLQVDQGRKPMLPIFWLHQWARLDPQAQEALVNLASTWHAGNRRASIGWLNELILMLRGQRVSKTENSSRAAEFLEGIRNRLEQEAFKVELFWLCGVPCDESQAPKVSEAVASGSLPRHPLGVRWR